MSKLARTLALAAMMAVSASAVTVATAQEKTKKTDKADDKKAAKKATGSVEVLENKSGKWYYKVLNADGKTIAMSQPLSGFAEKADAVKALEELKEILESAKVTYPPKKGDDKEDKEEMKKKKDKG